MRQVIILKQTNLIGTVQIHSTFITNSYLIQRQPTTKLVAQDDLETVTRYKC